jgi:Trk-type K+ transport system membrane component
MKLAEIEGDEENIRERMWHIVAYLFTAAGVIAVVTVACLWLAGA